MEKLKELNKHIKINKITSSRFKQYGRIIPQNELDFSQLINYMNENVFIPDEGNVYEPSNYEMEKMPIYNELVQKFYGGMPAQIGFCNGNNSSLNGLEYHKSSEINVAVTDMILLLGKVQDINNNTYESKNIEAFFVPKGKAVELYQTTLHFSPCKTQKDGFKCIVILPKGTNTAINIEKNTNKKLQEAQLLFMKNKWLLVHPSNKRMIEKGAHIGIKGDNIKINLY